MGDAGMTIGRLAAAAGVGVETVRYYQREGLLVEPPRPLGGVRRYDAPAVARIRFIRQAQTLGFGLADIRELLCLEDGATCRVVKRLAATKLAAVREKLAQLRRIEAALADLAARCAEAEGEVSCPIIAALGRSTAGAG